VERVEESAGVADKLTVPHAPGVTGVPVDAKAFKDRHEVQHPGARGGHWYRTQAGEIRYGEQPRGPHEALPGPPEPSHFQPGQEVTYQHPRAGLRTGKVVSSHSMGLVVEHEGEPQGAKYHAVPMKAVRSSKLTPEQQEAAKAVKGPHNVKLGHNVVWGDNQHGTVISKGPEGVRALDATGEEQTIPWAGVQDSYEPKKFGKADAPNIHWGDEITFKDKSGTIHTTTVNKALDGGVNVKKPSGHPSKHPTQAIAPWSSILKVTPKGLEKPVKAQKSTTSPEAPSAPAETPEPEHKPALSAEAQKAVKAGDRVEWNSLKGGVSGGTVLDADYKGTGLLQVSYEDGTALVGGDDLVAHEPAKGGFGPHNIKKGDLIESGTGYKWKVTGIFPNYGYPVQVVDSKGDHGLLGWDEIAKKVEKDPSPKAPESTPKPTPKEVVEPAKPAQNAASATPELSNPKTGEIKGPYGPQNLNPGDLIQVEGYGPDSTVVATHPDGVEFKGENDHVWHEPYSAITQAHISTEKFEAHTKTPAYQNAVAKSGLETEKSEPKSKQKWQPHEMDVVVGSTVKDPHVKGEKLGGLLIHSAVDSTSKKLYTITHIATGKSIGADIIGETAKDTKAQAKWIAQKLVDTIPDLNDPDEKKTIKAFKRAAEAAGYLTTSGYLSSLQDQARSAVKNDSPEPESESKKTGYEHVDKLKPGDKLEYTGTDMSWKFVKFVGIDDSAGRPAMLQKLNAAGEALGPAMMFGKGWLNRKLANGQMKRAGSGVASDPAFESEHPRGAGGKFEEKPEAIEMAAKYGWKEGGSGLGSHTIYFNKAHDDSSISVEKKTGDWEYNTPGDMKSGTGGIGAAIKAIHDIKDSQKPHPAVNKFVTDKFKEHGWKASPAEEGLFTHPIHGSIDVNTDGAWNHFKNDEDNSVESVRPGNLGLLPPYLDKLAKESGGDESKVFPATHDGGTEALKAAGWTQHPAKSNIWEKNGQFIGYAGDHDGAWAHWNKAYGESFGNEDKLANSPVSDMNLNDQKKPENQKKGYAALIKYLGFKSDAEDATPKPKKGKGPKPLGLVPTKGSVNDHGVTTANIAVGDKIVGANSGKTYTVTGAGTSRTGHKIFKVAEVTGKGKGVHPNYVHPNYVKEHILSSSVKAKPQVWSKTAKPVETPEPETTPTPIEWPKPVLPPGTKTEEEVAPGLKKITVMPEAKFDPEALKKIDKPNFLNWGGSGKHGPSSSLPFGKANQAAVDAIQEAALTGSADAVKAVMVQGVDKASGAPTGTDTPVLNAHSVHVKGYAETMIKAIEEQLQPVAHEFYEYTGDNPLAAVAHGAPAITSPAHKKAMVQAGKTKAKYLDLGNWGAMPEKLYKALFGEAVDPGKATSYFKTETKKVAGKLTSTQKSGIAYLKSDPNNSLVWAGNADGMINAASSAIHEHGIFVPPNMPLYRNMQISGDSLQQLQGATGHVLQEMGWSHSSPHGQPGQHGKPVSPYKPHYNVHLTMRLSPGAKSLYVGPDVGINEGFGNEYEAGLPKDTRLWVQKVETIGGHTYIDMIVLPHDLEAFHGSKKTAASA
jgi:hypothetical protein